MLDISMIWFWVQLVTDQRLNHKVCVRYFTKPFQGSIDN